jgi:mevalonate kinase
VKKLKDQNPQEMAKIFKEYKNIVNNAKKALKVYDLAKVGRLMNRNHELLKKITVSCKELDDMCSVAIGAGALGAKLTGTGRGGLMIALTPGKEAQKKVAEALRAKGFEAIETAIG